MMARYGMNPGFGWLWIVGAIVLLVFVAGVVLFALGRTGGDEATRILDERLARGDIGIEEHARMRAALGGRATSSGLARMGVVLAVVSMIALLLLGGLTVAGAWPRPGPASIDPGSPGYVPGTQAAPRVIRIVAGADLRFHPDVVAVAAGETITFEVTTMGWTAHEFMVGPAADVAADNEGTPEVADIGMMQTATLTYTFSGSGPFAFACHAPGHYEAGMKGTITIRS